jgi:hypothetical protein
MFQPLSHDWPRTWYLELWKYTWNDIPTAKVSLYPDILQAEDNISVFTVPEILVQS